MLTLDNLDVVNTNRDTYYEVQTKLFHSAGTTRVWKELLERLKDLQEDGVFKLMRLTLYPESTRPMARIMVNGFIVSPADRWRIQKVVDGAVDSCGFSDAVSASNDLLAAAHDLLDAYAKIPAIDPNHAQLVQEFRRLDEEAYDAVTGRHDWPGIRGRCGDLTSPNTPIDHVLAWPGVGSNYSDAQATELRRLNEEHPIPGDGRWTATQMSTKSIEEHRSEAIMEIMEQLAPDVARNCDHPEYPVLHTKATEQYELQEKERWAKVIAWQWRQLCECSARGSVGQQRGWAHDSWCPARGLLS